MRIKRVAMVHASNLQQEMGLRQLGSGLRGYWGGTVFFSDMMKGKNSSSGFNSIISFRSLNMTAMRLGMSASRFAVLSSRKCREINPYVLAALSSEPGSGKNLTW